MRDIDIIKNRFGINKSKHLNDKNVFSVMNGKKVTTTEETKTDITKSSKRIVREEKEEDNKTVESMKNFKETLLKELDYSDVVSRLEKVLNLIDKVKSFKVTKSSDWKDAAKLVDIMPDIKSINIKGIEKDIAKAIEYASESSGINSL